MLLDESGVGINSNMNAVIYHQTAVVNYQHPALTKYQNLTDKSSKWGKKWELLFSTVATDTFSHWTATRVKVLCGL